MLCQGQGKYSSTHAVGTAAWGPALGMGADAIDSVTSDQTQPMVCGHSFHCAGRPAGHVRFGHWAWLGRA